MPPPIHIRLLQLGCLSQIAAGMVIYPKQASAEAAGVKKLPALHARGQDVVDSKGNVVALRGVNVGGWLVTEGWMCGQKDKKDRNALEQLEARFGPEKAAGLMKAWQDNWFTARDLDAIEKLGFNVIRVPFGYRTLQDAAGNWIRDNNRKIDFSRMDWVVEQAGKRGIYVIFDLHVWPGEYGWPSRATQEGQQVRARMSLVWSEVARHFRGVESIAAMDVINEPEGSPGDLPQHAFYDAIRRQDPGRMIVVETISYPNIPRGRWKNIVWSAHYPENSLKTGAVEERLAQFEEKEHIAGRNSEIAPIYIGEMKAPQDTLESAVELAHALNRRGWSWTVWTYKGVDNGGWAGFNYYGSLKYDLAADPYDVLMQKWSADLIQWQTPGKPANWYRTRWWLDGYRRAAGEPVVAKK